MKTITTKVTFVEGTDRGFGINPNIGLGVKATKEQIKDMLERYKIVLIRKS